MTVPIADGDASVGDHEQHEERTSDTEARAQLDELSQRLGEVRDHGPQPEQGEPDDVGLAHHHAR